MLATPDPSCAATCNLCLILALMICHLQMLFSSEGGLIRGLNTNSRLVWPYFDSEPAGICTRALCPGGPTVPFPTGLTRPKLPMRVAGISVRQLILRLPVAPLSLLACDSDAPVTRGDY
jgi:hypothetical protein